MLISKRVLAHIQILSSIMAVCFLLGVPVNLQAQVTDKFTNLQILPQDIEKQTLLDLMGKYRSALGVSCSYCHVGGEKMDYVSDEKDTKQIARRMMVITQQINATLMPDLKHTPVPEVTCATCHHRLTQPNSNLPQILTDVYQKDGIETTVQKYRELREKHYGRGIFDFGEYTLMNLAAALQQSSEKDEAPFHLLQLNLEHYPESFNSQYRLGKVYRDRGDTETALRYFKQVLEIRPDHKWAKGNIERLTKPQTGQ